MPESQNMENPSWCSPGSFIPLGELSQCWQVHCRLLERRGHHDSYPTVNPSSCKKDVLARHAPWCNSCMNINGEVNHFLIRFNHWSIKEKPDLTLLLGQGHVARQAIGPRGDVTDLILLSSYDIKPTDAVLLNLHDNAFVFSAIIRKASFSSRWWWIQSPTTHQGAGNKWLQSVQPLMRHLYHNPTKGSGITV